MEDQEEEMEEISLTDLFPDPADFVPPSPTFTFPPLPPSPPDGEDPETVTESTGRVLSSHWSSNNQAWLSLVGSRQCVAAPALLWHKAG